MTTKLTEEEVKSFAMTVGQVADHIREWAGEIINTRDRTQNAHDMLDKANVYEINGTHTGLLNRIGILIRERDSLQSKLAKSEERVKTAESERDSLAAKCNRQANDIQQLAGTNDSLKQQLAEATNPVGDEKEIDMNNLNHDTHFYEPSEPKSKYEKPILLKSIALHAIAAVVVVAAMIGAAFLFARMLG